MTKMTEIRQKYGCKGDVLLNTAIQMLMEAGTENLKDEDYLRGIMTHVNARRDKAEQEGKRLWIPREFEVALWECAAELATLELSEILAYIQTEMCWLADTVLSYKRMEELFQNCLHDISGNTDGRYAEEAEALHKLREIGLEDEEFERLGYGYLLDLEEEDDENY